MTDLHARYVRAQQRFDHRDFRGAAELLAELVDQTDLVHGVADARLLLARAYYHSAQLKAAEREARRLLDDDPTDGYAALLLARTLQRGNRREEAEPYLRRAEALGVAG